MKIAGFKDLCMDATDAMRQASFWAGVLGGRVVDLNDGSARVDLGASGPGRDSIWIDPVPEPRVGRTRVRPDLRLLTPDPAPLLTAGATLLREPGADPWWVLADPDGNEFRAFPPAGFSTLMATEATEATESTEATEATEVAGVTEVTGVAGPTGATAGRSGAPAAVFALITDCRDAAAQAAWWAGVTGARVETTGSAAYLTGVPGFPWDQWVFAPAAESKTVKNRVHWDVDLAGGDVTPLLAAGATLLREPGGDISWWVLADPEGNEFCAFAARTG